MSKLQGGIFSRPAGKTGGLVFGAARTRTGKVATSRLLVRPSNPQTADQQAQRAIFSDSLEAVRQIGASIYQDDWNRAISQLPGFHSLMSILMNDMDSSGLLTAPPDTPLGSLHFPDTFASQPGSLAGEIDLTWSTENGPDGTTVDTLTFIAIPTTRAQRTATFVVKLEGAEERQTGNVTINGLQTGIDYIVACYFVGVGAAQGKLTLARWVEDTAT